MDSFSHHYELEVGLQVDLARLAIQGLLVLRLGSATKP